MIGRLREFQEVLKRTRVEIIFFSPKKIFRDELYAVFAGYLHKLHLKVLRRCAVDRRRRGAHVNRLRHRGNRRIHLRACPRPLIRRHSSAHT